MAKGRTLLVEAEGPSLLLVPSVVAYPSLSGPPFSIRIGLLSPCSSPPSPLVGVLVINTIGNPSSEFSISQF